MGSPIECDTSTGSCRCFIDLQRRGAVHCLDLEHDTIDRQLTLEQFCRHSSSLSSLELAQRPLGFHCKLATHSSSPSIAKIHQHTRKGYQTTISSQRSTISLPRCCSRPLRTPSSSFFTSRMTPSTRCVAGDLHRTTEVSLIDTCPFAMRQ